MILSQDVWSAIVKDTRQSLKSIDASMQWQRLCCCMSVTPYSKRVELRAGCLVTRYIIWETSASIRGSRPSRPCIIEVILMPSFERKNVPLKPLKCNHHRICTGYKFVACVLIVQEPVNYVWLNRRRSCSCLQYRKLYPLLDVLSMVVIYSWMHRVLIDGAVKIAQFYENAWISVHVLPIAITW